MGELEFPCEGTAVYDHWNPRRVNPKQSPAPSVGTSDQYELGDLSGKFGTLDGYNEYNADYNDTIMPLFGYETILGNSSRLQKIKLKLNTFKLPFLSRPVNCYSQTRQKSALVLQHTRTWI